MPEAAVATAPPVVSVNDLSTGRTVPVYVGADPPIELSTETDPVARGDVLATPPAAKLTEETPPPETPPKEETPPATEEEPPSAAAKDGSPDRDANGRFVPKKRFDEVNERRRLAEEKLAQIERDKEAATKAATAPAYDFDAKEQQYIELILDGKTKDAATLRAEIRTAELAQYERVATTKATETNRAATVEQQINGVVADYEGRIPQFNPEHESYSEDLLDDVNAFYTGYLSGKKFDNAADAFRAAITKALKVHGIDDKPPTTNGVTNGGTPPARTAARRIDAIKNQPPNIGRSGTGSTEHGDANIRIGELSEAEFARLPEATRRRLRGDNL